MTNHSTGASTETPARDYRLLIVLALAAGLTIGVLTAAFAQGYGWHPGFMGGWHHGVLGGGWRPGGSLSPAQIDERIDRGSKHLAIELDATPEQQQKFAAIAKSAVHDLLPLREKARAARGQALTLLTAGNVDREAIERLRAEQVGLAEMASKRIAQALADAFDVLTPEQRRKVADWVTASDRPWARWHRD